MRVLLVCSAGMSTSLLAAAMTAAAEAAGTPLEVAAAGASELPEALAGVSAVLVGPQIRHRFGQIEAACREAGVPAGVIDGRVYGLVDGPAALAQAVALAKGGA